jgi:hypothetical protein
MNARTAQQILAADDLSIEEVATPEWGGNVFIRQMMGKELGVFSKLLKGTKEVQEFPIQAIATVCALTLCNEKGERLFPDHVQGAKQLEEKNSRVLQRIFAATMVLSSLSSGGTPETETPGKV